MFKPTMQSPLHHFDLPAQARPQDDSCGVWANELPLRGYVILRGNAAEPAFIAGVGKALGVAPPTRPCTFARADAGTLLWLSPDEWLLTCDRSRVVERIAGLESALAGQHVQVADNSGGLTQVYLSGREHVTLLRHVGVYDFESITPGKAVGTACGKASVVVYRVDAHGLFVIFRRSFADYVWRLLVRAGQPYGFGICTPPADQGIRGAVKAVRDIEPDTEPDTELLPA